MALTLPYADDYRSHGSLPKPTKFDRQAAKAARKTLIAKVKLKEQRQAMKVYADFRKRIYARDGGLCRAYGEPLKLLTDNVLTLAHVHHITFKSAGGEDTLENCCPRWNCYWSSTNIPFTAKRFFVSFVKSFGIRIFWPIFCKFFRIRVI